MNYRTVSRNSDSATRNGGASLERAIGTLQNILSDGVDIHRCAAAQTLGRIGHGSSMKPLIAALRDEDEDVRTDAAGALARFGDRTVAKPLLESLIGDPCGEVKLAAIEALGRLGCRDATPWLRRLVKGRDENIAWDEDEFHTGGWDDWVDIQIKSIEALAELGAEDAAPDIVLAVDDEHGQELTEIAFSALARLGEPGRNALAELREKGYERRVPAAPANPAVEDTEEAPAVSTETLIERLGEDDRQASMKAMAALAASAAGDWPNDAGTALLAALRGELVPSPEVEEAEPEKEPETHLVTDEAEESDAEPAVPTSTLQAILEPVPTEKPSMAMPDAGVALTQADMERLALAVRYPKKKVVAVLPAVAPHQDVRRFAARVLGDVPRADVALALAVALVDDDREVKHAAADSLARVAAELTALPPEVITALEARLATTDDDLRRDLVRALANGGAADSVQTLKKLTRDEDSFVRVEAVRGLARVGIVVEKLLDDAEPSVRLVTAEAYAASKGPASVGRLVEFAFSFEGYHRRQAARLLRGLDANAASDLFVDALEDTQRRRSWPVAIEALEEIHGAKSDALPQPNLNEKEMVA